MTKIKVGYGPSRDGMATWRYWIKDFTVSGKYVVEHFYKLFNCNGKPYIAVDNIGELRIDQNRLINIIEEEV